MAKRAGEWPALASIRRQFSSGVGLRLGAAAAMGIVLIAAAMFVKSPPGLAPPGMRVEYGENPELSQRALSERARWRAQPSLQQARAYADALFAAGMEEEVIAEMANRDLLAEAPVEAMALRAEAQLRMGRYREAVETASKLPQERAQAFAAFVRARANYALQGLRETIEADLRTALSGGPEVVAAAWMFRARIALDENDERGAEAASRRAAETGATRRDLRLSLAEMNLRAGRGDEARAALEAIRSERRGRASLLNPADEARLQSMILARDGAFGEAAAAYPPSTAQLSANPHDALLPALYQLQAGKPDVAAASMGAFAAASPDHWAALDLALAAASVRGDEALAAATAERLFVVRPTLAIVRMVRIATAAGDHDAALAALDRAAAPVGRGTGAMTLLIGPTAIAHPLLSDSTTAELALLDAASLDPSASDRERKRAADAVAASSGPPAGDLVAARLLLANGDASAAALLARRARKRAPQFLAAAVFEANARMVAGDAPGAYDILNAFIAAAPQRADARLAAARLAASSGDDRAAEVYLQGAPEALVYKDEALAKIALGVAARGGEDSLRRATDAALKAVSTEQVAIALMAVGRHAEAAALARAALSADPRSQSAPELYLDAMTRAGARAEAAALLETLVRRHPDASAAAAALYRARDPDSGGKTG